MTARKYASSNDRLKASKRHHAFMIELALYYIHFTSDEVTAADIGSLPNNSCANQHYQKGTRRSDVPYLCVLLIFDSKKALHASVMTWS